MKSNRFSAIALMFTASLATGCSVSNISTHSAVVDHSDVKPSGQHNHYRSDERGSFRSPKSDHVSLKGDASKVFLAAGQQHFTQQNFGLAEENFRKAVEVRSDSPTGWLGLAASLDQLGRFEQADTAYRQVSELKSNNARVLNNWGYSHLLRGNYQKARKFLNRAQNIDPSLEEVQGNIHLLDKTINS
jgi:tetratricopeptide (TPR) repeat protein